MATDRKTVVFCSDLMTTTFTSNAQTAVTMPDIFLPESSKVFRSVAVHVHWTDIVTATGSSYNTRWVWLGLGGGGKTLGSNANTLTNSGENIAGYFCQDLTSRFATSWTGTSMTCQIDVGLTMAGGTFTGYTNVVVMVEIDYEYDDASATQIKTVFLQLNTPNGAMGTVKPASLYTIPGLSTDFPEASKVFRGKWILVGGNTNNNASIVDASMSVEIETGGVQTSALIESALASDCAYTLIFKPTWDETLTRTWHVWGSVARFHHAYAYAIVTYEFDASAANDVYHSLLLPMQMDSPIGASVAGNVQFGERDLWIAELGTITTKRTGVIFHWQQWVALTGLNVKARGADGFTTLTDVAGVLCGSNAGQAITSGYTLARGRQTLRAEIYISNPTINLHGGNLNALWLVNYTAPKMAGGHGAHTKTRLALSRATGTGAATNAVVESAAVPFAVPQANHFLAAVGLWMRFVPNTGSGISGFTYQFERLSTGGEGGVGWEAVYTDIGSPDGEVGTYTMFAQTRALFRRWPGDDFSNRVDLATSRRARWANANQSTGTNQTGWLQVQQMVTYHAHTWTVAGNVRGSNGGTVTISLYRHTTGEKVLETTRAGDGAFSFTWFDNTELLFLVARDDSNVNRRFVSDTFLADTAVSHTLRLWNPRPRIIDATIVSKR